MWSRAAAILPWAALTAAQHAFPVFAPETTLNTKPPAVTETYAVSPNYAQSPTTSPASTRYTTAPYPTPTSNATLPKCKEIQYNYAKGAGGNSSRAAAVASAYRYAWNAYEEYAYGYDELLPLSAQGTNDWYGWGVTIVDGIDTAIIMNLTDIVEKQLAFIATIDFTTTDTAAYGPVEIFDTNIRYVGGLLSAYDLLKSGKFPNPYNQTQVDLLLTQAARLADKIAYGFDTPSGLAASNVDWDTNTPAYGTYQASNGTVYRATNTASIGTFILEFTRLSDLTGNQTYRELAYRAEVQLINPHPAPVYPGLVGAEWDVDAGVMLTFDGGWHSEVDSFLEYLIKTYQYKVDLNTTAMKDFWVTAVESTIDHIALHPYGWPDLTFISYLDVNGSIEYLDDDFTCFAGGNYLLGSRILNNSAFYDLGIAATDGCHQTYNHSTTGLGPIAWAWFNESDQAYSIQDTRDIAEHRNNNNRGFYIPEGDESWEFRPEEIESIFYAHRITGDPRWAEYNWEIFEAIQNIATAQIAYATVNNVDMPYGGTMSDNLDSFFFAEVLKYMYLTFADPSVVNLEQWVFNTEAHPFLVQCGLGDVDDPHGKPVGTGV